VTLTWLDLIIAVALGFVLGFAVGRVRRADQQIDDLLGDHRSEE